MVILHPRRGFCSNYFKFSYSSAAKMSETLSRAETRKYYGWLELIIMTGMAFSMVENPYLRSRSNLPTICRKTFMKYMNLMSEEVFKNIKKELPDKFGLILDGWKASNTVHYIGIYATYPVASVRVKTLLAICPFVYERDHGADSYYATIEATLEYYGKTLANLYWFTTVNTSVNRSLANKLGIPFVGCYAHKLNLIIKHWLSDVHDDTIENVRKVMIHLRNSIPAAYLREVQEDEGQPLLKALKDNDTRWSSIFNMLQRFVKLQNIASKMTDDDQLMELLDAVDVETVKLVLRRLEPLNDYMIRIQDPSRNLDYAVSMFNQIHRDFRHLHNSFNHYIEQDALTYNPDFDRVVVKLLSGEDNLTETEREAVSGFLTPAGEAVYVPEEVPENLSEAALFDWNFEQSRKRRKLQDKDRYDIALLNCIAPTSCDCERLFSQCKLTNTDIRQSMTPKNFEARIYLRENSRFWVNDVSTNVKDYHGERLMEKILRAESVVEF